MRSAEQTAAAVAEVIRDYQGRDLGGGRYLVQHPTDPQRRYVVDTRAGTCTCPSTVKCRHLIAIERLTETLRIKAGSAGHGLPLAA